MKYKKGNHADHKALIAKSVKLLNKGMLINENNLGVGKSKFKTMIISIKKDHGLDVLTVNRGHQTIGWILASEIIK